MIAVNFTEIFRNICSVIDNHIEFSSLLFDIIENQVQIKINQVQIKINQVQIKIDKV